MANKKSFRDSALIMSILYILVGALLLIFRAETIGWAMTIAGVVFVVSGILELIKKNYVGGAVSAIIGIVILVLGWALAQIVLLVLGVLIAFKGVVALFTVLKSSDRSALGLVFPVLTILCGLALAFAFGELMDIMIIVGGVMILIDGIFGLIAALKK